jgi:hypothetical protein
VRPYLVFAFIALILYLAVQVFLLLSWIDHAPSFTLEIILFLLFITSLIYRYIFRFSPQGPETVSKFYLLSIAIKLLGGCALMAAVIIIDKTGAIGNVVLFLTGYVLFTTAEIIFLMLNKD